MLSTEKIAYLKGLAAGLELGSDTKQDKLITAIIDVLDSVVRDIESLDADQEEISNVLDAVSDDLENVEKIVYDDYDADGCCCGGDAEYEDSDYAGGETDGGGCCGHHHDADSADGEEGHHCCHDHGDEPMEDGDEAEGHHCCHGEGGHEGGGCCHNHGNLYQVVCPGCGNPITIDDHILDIGRMRCPHCGAMLEFDAGGEEDVPPEGDSPEPQPEA